MKIYRFYSDWYDKHVRREELEKHSIDAWSSQKIPEHLRTKSYDYLVEGIPSQQPIGLERIHIWEDLPEKGGGWKFSAMNDNGFNKFDLKTFVTKYPETIEEVDSFPPLPFDFYRICLYCLFTRDNKHYEKIRKLCDKLGMFK